MGRYVWAVAVLLSATVMACAARPTPGARPAQTPVPQPTRTPLIALPAEAEELVQAARSALADRLQQADEVIDLVDVEPAEWPTSAMGCPQPDRMYAQVITPGYVVRLKAMGKVYEVHVSKAGQVVFCEAGGELREMKVPANAEPAVMAAKRDLASRAGVAVEDVRIVEFQAVEWRDSSLGCPEPGKMYMQVITPGYRVVLEAGGQTYEYHTNQGNRAVLCGKTATSGTTQRLRLEELRSVVERARNDLSQRLGVNSAGIVVTTVLPVSQVAEPAPCPEASRLAGSGTDYQVVLQAGGETYVYRVQGDMLVLCTQ